MIIGKTWEIKMELFSGDILLVICESLECTEETL